jgi:hypothetical protein
MPATCPGANSCTSADDGDDGLIVLAESGTAFVEVLVERVPGYEMLLAKGPVDGVLLGRVLVTGLVGTLPSAAVPGRRSGWRAGRSVDLVAAGLAKAT